MRTHDVAKVLSDLAKVLRSLPDVPMADLGEMTRPAPPTLSKESMTVGLTTLMALSDIDKRQWASFIAENNFPVRINAKDSSRNILGKLLTYLQSHPEARDRLTNTARAQRSSTSPELQRALEILLRTS